MPIVPPCFSDIELDYAVLAGRVFPKIRIYDQIVPYYYNPSSDFFILEKYVIDPNDPVQMQVLENVIVGQITLYYMSATAYMSSFIWMASEEYDLGVEPERIDISRTFLAGTPYVIDLNAEIGTTLYIYRISSYYRGREWASHYVAGLRDMPVSSGLDLDEYLGEVLFRSEEGAFIRREGSLYRRDRYGNIITKGLPIMEVGRRYRGPIEPEKENASRNAILSALSNVVEWLDRGEALLAGMEDDVQILGMSASHLIGNGVYND